MYISVYKRFSPLPKGQKLIFLNEYIFEEKFYSFLPRKKCHFACAYACTPNLFLNFSASFKADGRFERRTLLQPVAASASVREGRGFESRYCCNLVSEESTEVTIESSNPSVEKLLQL
jgi:hypothetical protein